MTKPAAMVITLSVLSTAQAGTFTIIPPGGFEVDTQYNSVSHMIADFDCFDTLSPMIGVRNLSGYPMVTYSGGFYVDVEWTPAFAGENPPAGAPFLHAEAEAMIKCMPGSMGSVTYGSMVLINQPTLNTWHPIGAHYAEASFWNPDGTGKWLAHFPMDMFTVNATASGPNNAITKLRMNLVGVDML